jgi:general secretion pathway protein A
MGGAVTAERPGVSAIRPPGAGYERVFGLRERPFALTPDPRYHVRTAAHAQALAAVGLARQYGEPMMRVTGDFGAGTTTLGLTLLAATHPRIRRSLLPTGLLRPDEFWTRLAADFGVVPFDEGHRDGLARATTGALRQLVVQALLGLPAPSPTALVVIDDAQLMPEPVADELLSLTALATHGRPLVQLVLLGPTGTADAHGLRRVEHAVTRRLHLSPMHRDETVAYVAHRLHVAGAAAPASLIPEDAAIAVHRCTGGTPRLVNLLCDRVLQAAADAGREVVRPADVEGVAEPLSGDAGRAFRRAS